MYVVHSVAYPVGVLSGVTGQQPDEDARAHWLLGVRLSREGGLG